MPEIYSGNKILFALLVDGTINSSGIFRPLKEEHVLCGLLLQVITLKYILCETRIEYAWFQGHL